MSGVDEERQCKFLLDVQPQMHVLTPQFLEHGAHLEICTALSGYLVIMQILTKVYSHDYHLT
jgi:hypothetical protein